MKTIQELRAHYVSVAGFSGAWNVTLETFKEVWSEFGLVAISAPRQPASWVTGALGRIGREVPIGNGLVVIVIDNWESLEIAVRSDALRERFLVDITGTLTEDKYVLAKRFSGRQDGRVRRSKVGVPVGQAYWYPTDEQLAAVV